LLVISCRFFSAMGASINLYYYFFVIINKIDNEITYRFLPAEFQAVYLIIS